MAEAGGRPEFGPGSRTAFTCALVASLIVISGCSDTPSTPGPTPTDQVTTAAPVTSSQSPETEAVLAAYRDYWAARTAALATPGKALPKSLKRYGTGQAVSDVRATVLLFRTQGIVMRGRPSLNPKVVSVGADRASISDCVDSTAWQPLFVATGKSAAAPGQAARVVMNSTVTRAGSRWSVATAVVERDRTC